MKWFRKMRLNSTARAAFALALMAAPGAMAWETGFERGLEYYTTGSAGVVLTLVCDPNSVFGATSTSGLLIRYGAEQDYSGPLRLAFPNGAVIATDAVHGRIGNELVEDATWEALLEALRANSALELELGQHTLSVDLGEPVEFTCV